MDASAIQVLYEMVKEFERDNIFVCFVKLRSHLKIPFISSGIIGPLGGDIMFEKTNQAIRYIQENHPLQPNDTMSENLSIVIEESKGEENSNRLDEGDSFFQNICSLVKNFSWRADSENQPLFISSTTEINNK